MMGETLQAGGFLSVRALRVIPGAGSVAAAVLLATLCCSPLRAQTPPAPDIWPEHAATDDDVARHGRAALPFTRAQIEQLARLLEQTQQATAKGTGRAPTGRTRRIRVAEDDIPEIAVRRGYTTVVSFSDITGAPWPIEEAMVDRRFLPEGEGPPAAAESHLLYIAPRRAYLRGNIAVKLRSLPDPVVATLSGGGNAADFRVDLRVADAGPNVDPAALALPESFQAGDAALLGLLTGATPPGAERLTVEGGGHDTRAWKLEGDLLLVTRSHVLSPGPLAAERASGRWAYRLPNTPFALVARDGHPQRLGFREETAVEPD